MLEFVMLGLFKSGTLGYLLTSLVIFTICIEM